MKKIIAVVFVSFGLFVVSAVGQGVRPLGITIEAKANFDQPEWRWTPVIGFRLLGPVGTGERVTVDFTLPNGSPWLTVKCDSSRIEQGASTRIGGCGFNSPDAEKATNRTGVFGFQIKLGGRALYSGQFAVAKILYNPDGTPAKNKQFYYFVDNDFRLGIGYVGPSAGDLSTNLFSEFWVKNRIRDKAELSGILLYNGKQVAETWPSYSLESHPKENPKQEFTLVGLNFPVLMAEPEAVGMSDVFRAYKNPGEYEIRLMRDGSVARSIKFSVGRDGKLVQNGIGKDLFGDGILVPLEILGDSDGVIDKAAYRKGLWGNPISGLN